jgi:diadenosine tetraphosphatase ApaH/serine/threonine PP2A family protein phosphatase
MARELTEELRLSRDRKYLITPGAVGQPRDGDPQAAFLMYDSRERAVVFLRVGYDIPACQAKIIRAGLPTRLAERLSMGR